MEGVETMMSGGTDTISREEILDHNLRLHEATAAQYDQIHYYLRNAYEQIHLQRCLARMHRCMEARTTGPVRYLDLGCGTGNITLKLLAMGGQVTGVDLAPAMIEILADKVHAAGYTDHFHGLVGSADDLLSIPGVRDILADVQAVCISSVLHHLFDYLTPFRQLRELCPDLQAVFVTHEPCSRSSLRPAGPIRQFYNTRVRALDVRLSSRIMRPAEGAHDDPTADFHAFGDGIDEGAIEGELCGQGLGAKLIHSRYNMRRTTVASALDNVVFSPLRNDIFPITMFTLAMVRDRGERMPASGSDMRGNGGGQREA